MNGENEIETRTIGTCAKMNFNIYRDISIGSKVL